MVFWENHLIATELAPAEGGANGFPGSFISTAAG